VNYKLADQQGASRLGAAFPCGMGNDGSSPMMIFSSCTYFGRSYRVTNSLPGVYSNTSVTFSPIFFAPDAWFSGSIISTSLWGSFQVHLLSK